MANCDDLSGRATSPFFGATGAGLFDGHRFAKSTRFFLSPAISNSLRGVLPRLDLSEYPPRLIHNECARAVSMMSCAQVLWS